MKTLGVVLAVGARTPIGLDAVQTGFLLRTGMPVITGAPIAAPDGEAITMAFDPTLDPYLVGEERAVELAKAALAEVARPLGPGARSLRLAIVLGLSEPIPGTQSDTSSVLGTLLRTTLREHFGDAPVQLSMRGGGGVIGQLAAALGALERRDIDAILFGGIHTDYDPRTIAWLYSQGRLFSPKNLDALIPGEAAAFVLIAHRDLAPRLGITPLARIHGTGAGMEEATPDNDKSAFRAKGLSTAVRAATKDLPDEMRVGWALSDHTFELRRLHEWQAMLTRTRKSWCAPLVTDSPAQRMGHLGAAALPVSIAIAAEAFSRGYAPFPLALCFAGSDGGERGTILVGSV